jgi:hypothetical protein
VLYDLSGVAAEDILYDPREHATTYLALADAWTIDEAATVGPMT